MIDEYWRTRVYIDGQLYDDEDGGEITIFQVCVK